MRNSKKRLLAAATVLLCASPVLAQDVPPPANLQSEDAIVAWAKSAKIVDDTASPRASWQIIGASDQGLHMAVIQQQKDAAGIAKVGLRLERFKPDGAGAAISRSTTEFYDIDCGKKQIRATLVASFADHNLTGVKQDKPLTAWAPIASNDLVDAISDDACKAGGATVAAAAAAAPKSAADAAAWAKSNAIRTDNVNNQDWKLANYTADGVMYVAISKRDDATRTANMALRLERFNPLANAKVNAVASEATTYEINCRTSRLRRVATAGYTEHNLQGRDDSKAVLDEWSAIKDHPVLGKLGSDFCRDFVPERRFR